MMKNTRLTIVLPCYNEERGLERTIEVVSRKIADLVAAGAVSPDSNMLFVDDGSTDATWKLIAENHQKNPGLVKGIRFAANRGKETALWAGMTEAGKHADIVACMDADLQFDINALDEFISCYEEGYELIYGIKKNRGKEPFIKKICAGCFYKLMAILGSPINNNHTDYCLVTNKVCEAMSYYGESFIIFRGLLKTLGFRQKQCYFNVLDREAGESHFSLRRLISLSLNAITSFSIVPLRCVALCGMLVFTVGLLMVIYSVVNFIGGVVPDGYTTLACSMWLLGGIGMLCMGVLGEYLGKLYMETKKRPRFYLSENLYREHEDS